MDITSKIAMMIGVLLIVAGTLDSFHIYSGGMLESPLPESPMPESPMPESPMPKSPIPESQMSESMPEPPMPEPPMPEPPMAAPAIPETPNTETTKPGWPFQIWPNQTVFYQITEEFSSEEVNLIEQSIQEIREKTCLKFVKRTDEQNYVLFARVKKDECYSNVGMIGREQVVNLDYGCMNKRSILHEILHAIGFHHEHVRSDRDDYITVNYENIKPNGKPNYTIRENLTILGVKYDYESVMHYGRYDFAINDTVPTIIARADANIGQTNGLSETDVIKINKLYQC